MTYYWVDISPARTGYEVEADTREDALLKAEELMIDDIQSGRSTYYCCETQPVDA